MTALYQKYRPTSFTQVIGQGAVVKSLQQVVKDGRARTFLFTGPSGTGKTTLARILANEFAGGKATVANIEEVAAADHTGVAEMRAILRRADFRAMGQSPLRAFIIDECHRLSGNAWDVLLKPIEEPPAHVMWAFCTTNPSKVPKTIITRCLRYDLKAVAEDDILDLLDRVARAEKLDVPDEVLEAIAEGAGGSPRQSLTFLEACGYAETAADARQIMRSAGQSREVIDLARFLVSGRGRNWAEAVKYVKALEGTDAEGARIAILAYLSQVLLGAKDEKRAVGLLGLVEPFLQPFDGSAKLAPLLYAVGLALGLDR